MDCFVALLLAMTGETNIVMAGQKREARLRARRTGAETDT